MPSIGYGSNKKTRHLMPDGFKKFIVHNVKVWPLFIETKIVACEDWLGVQVILNRKRKGHKRGFIYCTQDKQATFSTKTRIGVKHRF